MRRCEPLQQVARGPVGGIAQSVEHRPFKPLVLGSNPSAPTIFSRCIPVTWFTDYTGDMGNTFGLKGFSTCLVLEKCTLTPLMADELGIIRVKPYIGRTSNEG